MSTFSGETNGDPVVARALRAIAAPDHGPGFWDELADRIAGAPAVAGIHRLEPARAGRPLRVLAVAAVLAGVVGLAGLLATRNGGDEPSGVAEPATTTTETPTTDEPETTTTTTGRAVESPDEAVLRWIEAVGQGDVEAAAARTGPRTRAAVEGRGGDLEHYLTVAQEGFGAWAAVPDPTVTEVEIGEVGGETIGVVVLSGQRASEGQVEERHDPFPVVLAEDGRWLVEPAALPGEGDRRITVTSPSAAPGATGRNGLAPGEPIEAAAPGSGTFWFSIDGARGHRVEGEPVGGDVRATFTPDSISSGTHLLVVAYLDGGTFTAVADSFPVEG